MLGNSYRAAADRTSERLRILERETVKEFLAYVMCKYVAVDARLQYGRHSAPRSV